MTLDTPMTLALLQELLMAHRANDADGYKAWLASAIEELLSDIAAEVDSCKVLPSLVERMRKADNHKFINTINSRLEANLKK
jgi:hypothetical protein